MTLEQLLSTPVSSSQTSCSQIPNQMITTSKTRSCQVCGNSARFVNYGALTCQSCRAFFRRHGHRSKVIRPCQFDRQCEMDVQKPKQRVCIACRLDKCLSAGMSATYIRKETNKVQKCHSTTELNNTKIALTSSQIPTLDLLHTNRSTLNTVQWTLLSNVVHAYDTYVTTPHLYDITEQLSRLSIHQPSARSKPIEAIEFFIASMQSFIQSIPDFQILTVAEQRSLLERNLHGTAGFNSAFITRTSGMIDSSPFLANGLSIYGLDAVARAKRLENQLDPDSTLVKLMLIILTFSSNCLILNVPENINNDSLLLGTFRLLGSQNVYVELLWKYMIYRYGFHETVIRFASLVKEMLDVIDHLTKTYISNQSHQNFIDTAFNGDKQSFTTSLSEHVPLWGHNKVFYSN